MPIIRSCERIIAFPWDDDLAAPQVQILHPQPKAFHDPHARPIEESAHQPMRSFQLCEQEPRLFARQHHRVPARLFRSSNLAQPWQFDREHVTIEKQQSRERLLMGRRGNGTLGREVRQKSDNLGLGHLGAIRMDTPNWEERPFLPLEQMGNYSARDRKTAQEYGPIVIGCRNIKPRLQISL